MTEQRLSFMEFASPWFFNPGTVRLPSPPEGLSTNEVRERLLKGQLAQQPYILETPFERCLYFTQGNLQSIMSLAAPDALIAAYTRKMMAFLLFNPAPKRIKMIGLGGGSLAKFCYRNLPQAQMTVVEIDPRVVALRQEFRIPADDARFRVVCEDGAHYISQRTEPIDVLLVDAFDPIGVAPALAASDFYVQAAKRLSPRGVMVMNFSGAASRYITHIERITKAFGGSTLLVPVIADDNLLLFAFRRRIPLPTTARYESRAQRLQSRLTLEFPLYLRRICQGHVLT
jgi:spermidine synthase